MQTEPLVSEVAGSCDESGTWMTAGVVDGAHVFSAVANVYFEVRGPVTRSSLWLVLNP